MSKEEYQSVISQEREQHLHFIVNDFSRLVKERGAAVVMAAMDAETCWLLYKEMR